MSKIKINISVLKNKEFILNSLFLSVLLLVYSFFPTEDRFQQFITIIIFFVLLPTLYFKLIAKRSLIELGISLGEYKEGLIWSLLSLAAATLILLIFFKFFGLLKHYAVPADVVGDFKTFLIYELVTTLFFVLVYDFFFRGFVMFGFARYLGYGSVVLQFLIFMLLVFSISSNAWVFIPYLIFTPFAGIIALKSRSLVYSTLSQLLLIIILDSVVIHLLK